MGIRLPKFLFFILLFLTIGAAPAAAQNLTGIWRGYFITDGADNYKFELQIEQSKAKIISGVSYSYLSTVFYGKATLNGYFNTAGKSALIQEIKTVELRMAGGSTACIMKCKFVYSRSGKEEFLEGEYTSTYEKSSEEMGIKRGGNCGGGKIFLRKVTTSDFYVEPFLRENLATKKPTTAKPPAPVTRKPVAKPPVNHKPVAKATQKAPGTTTTKPPAKKEVATAKPKEDTTRRITNIPTVKTDPKPEIERPPFKMPAVTRARKNELTQSLNVNNEEITIRLYDNGEIDGDTISVYMDNKLILSNKLLTASPLTITLKMDEENSEHVLVMVAENMGTIPPNTSLMIVHDGDKRYEVRITSTEQKNAMVRFRYLKK